MESNSVLSLKYRQKYRKAQNYPAYFLNFLRKYRPGRAASVIPRPPAGLRDETGEVWTMVLTSPESIVNVRAGALGGLGYHHLPLKCSNTLAMALMSWSPQPKTQPVR
jgi:hypothetical protein